MAEKKPAKLSSKKTKTIVSAISGWWLLPIMFLGLFLRFYDNLKISLWHDEAFSALYIRDYPWKEMMTRIGLDVHPPLYYILLKLWSYVLGTSLLSLRGFSILFGVLTIWAGYLLVNKAFGNKRLAIITAFLIAINPFQIEYATEARMYTLGTFLVLISSYFLLKALESKKWRDWIIYAILAAAAIYTHYYLIFSVAAQGFYVIYWLFKNKQINKNLLTNQTGKVVVAYMVSFIIFLPWLKQFLIQKGRVDAQYWIGAMDRWSIPGTIWKMVFGGQGINHTVLAIATIVAFALIFLFIRYCKTENRMFVLLSLVVPFILAIILSLQQAIFLDRYFAFADLFFIILIAFVLDKIPHPTRNLVVAVVAMAIIFAFFKNWRDLGIDTKPGMAALSEKVNDNALPNDHIYVGSSFVYFTFRYYNETGIQPKLISDGALETIPHFSGTALLSPDDLVLTDTIFDNPEVKTNDTVWLIWTTGFGGSKPNVPGNWSKVVEYSYADAPGYKGIIYATEYHVN